MYLFSQSIDWFYFSKLKRGMLSPADDQQIDAGYATRMRPASRYKKFICYIILKYYIMAKDAKTLEKDELFFIF